MKITNSGVDGETRTLDIDKSDLQAVYDALARNKNSSGKITEDVENKSNVDYPIYIADKVYKIVKLYYNDLDDLCKRLQDDYNGDKEFVQHEEDRLALVAILDIIESLD